MVGTSEKKDKAIAVIGTIVVHSLLLLILIFIVFKTPIPPFPDSNAPGIEINFGNNMEGTGDVENDKMGNTDNSSENVVKLNQSNPADNTDAVVTNSIEDESINIKKIKKPKKTENKIEKTEPVKEVEEKPSSALAEALAKFKTKKANSTGGDGNSGQAGNQGDPNGSLEGNGDGGTGDHGKGTNFNLRGRILLKKPEITDDSQEEGKVVVEITVDETGKVIKANPGVRGSTTTNPMLYAKARQAAFSAKFNTSPEGIKEQKGTVTFVFILN